MSSSPI